jgi:translation initiation factor IF-3
MDNITPDPKQRGYLLPPGCKDLIDVLKSASPPELPPVRTFRVNGKIRAQEVRVIGEQGQKLGIMSLVDAHNLARAAGIDLVEVAPNAKPPLCRLVDFGKFRYELAKIYKKQK